MNTLFLQACRREPVDRVPVWYMRQAGRYQPEYRRIREQHSLLEICRNPQLCYEVTRLPVDQLGVDAAILFSDIMVPVGAMGVRFDIREGIGPVVEEPVRTLEQVERLRPVDPERHLPYVLESVDRLAQDLPVPLIGFSGAPFTLASYLIEGGPSRDYLYTKQRMWSDRTFWNALMDKLADMIITYLTAQVQAGARAVQLFDSWVGTLSPRDYAEYVLPTMQRIFAGLQPLDVPLIYFGVMTGELLPLMAQSGATVIGVDWRVPLDTARSRIGSSLALQGNLDPALLLAPWNEIERRAREIVDLGLQADGFIFNLGHGVIPSADVDTLRRLTAFVHQYSQDQIRARGRHGM